MRISNPAPFPSHSLSYFLLWCRGNLTSTMRRPDSNPWITVGPHQYSWSRLPHKRLFSPLFLSPSSPLGASLFVHLFIRRFFCVFIMCLFFLYSHIAPPKRQRYKYQCLSALSRSKLITEATLIKLHTFLAFLSLLLKHVGGSYKKIGYYDSSQGNLSWFGNDVWIGKMDFAAPIAQLPVSVFVSCVMAWVSRVTCLCFDFRPPLRGLI